MTRASLKSARDFRRVYRSGVTGRADGITVWAAPSTDVAPGRLGMAVRATVGTAVERNRLRRRIRSIVGSSATARGSDIVISANRGAIGRNYQQLTEAIETALDRAKGAR